MNLAKNAEEGSGAVGTDDVAVGFDLGPFAVHMNDVNDVSVGMMLVEETDRLANDGGGQPMAKERHIVLGGRLRCLEGGSFGGERCDFVAGGSENGLAKARQFEVQREGENLHGTSPWGNDTSGVRRAG